MSSKFPAADMTRGRPAKLTAAFLVAMILAASAANANIGPALASANIGGSAAGANIGGSAAGANIGGSAASANIGGSPASANINGSAAGANIMGSAASANFSGSAAGATVGVRQGRHGDMGRLVFDFPGVEAIKTHRAGEMLRIQFTPALPMPSLPVNLPGLRGVQGGNGFVLLSLTKGAVPHVYRLGDRVVVDARPAGHPMMAKPADLDAAIPKPPKSPPVDVKPAPMPPPNIAPAVRHAVTPPPVSVTGSPVSGSPGGSLPPVNATPLVMPAPTPNITAPAPEVINFDTQPGAAAFRRGNQAIIVFDTSEIPDIGALQSTPAFANAALVSLQAAQLIILPLPPAQSLAVTPVPGGWQVAVDAKPTSLPPPLPLHGTNIAFPMPSANRTVTISDPVTGNDLLVGTVNQSGAALGSAQSGPGFAILPAWLGVAVIPEADNLGLAVTPGGFELTSALPNGLPLGTLAPTAPVMAAALPGQGLNLPNGTTAMLRDRMLFDLQAAATLPPLGRLGAQIALASDMLALGLGPEANGVLDTAVLENPAAEDNGKIAEMRAVAGVVAQKYNPDDFSAPGIVGGGETAFWQAAGLAERGKTAQANALAANLALFESYPTALRNSVNAQVAEAMVDAGQLEAAQQLVDSDPGNPNLDLARAKLLERQGNAKPALAAYQALARSADTRVSAIAVNRAVELQLASGKLTAAAAADRLDAALFDWRAPEHERHLRMRIAQLRAQAGQWPQAFNMLQSARTRFPDHQSDIDAARSALFKNMLSSSQFAKLSPIQAVAILQQNQDLIPAGSGSADVIDLLAQRLDALDLPGAAAPMLNHLIQTIPPGVARARLGARLAQVDWDAGSPVATLADLAQTQADNLPPDLAAQRAILNAKAQAAGGNAVAAVTELTPAPGASASGAGAPTQLQTQAQIAEQSGQWPQAEQALGTLVSQTVPAAGPITGDPENFLLRLATAASHNNDTAMLSSLASQYGKRVSTDAAGQMFQTLTTPTLNGDQGLNQALHEIAQLQALPAMLDAVSAAPAARKP
jgi:hypothetical protein